MKRKVSPQVLRNLAYGRAVRKANLRQGQRPQRVQRVVQQPRRVYVPKGQQFFNRNLIPRINPDLDVSNTDVMVRERIASENETMFASFDDVFPRALQRRREE